MEAGEDERLLARGGLEHPVALADQDLVEHRAHLVLVLHQQDGLGAPVRGAGGGPAAHHLRLAGDRQVEREARALARRAVDEDVAAALPHDAVGGGEAEPRPLALGAEERLEDPGLGHRVHAGAGVGDRQQDVGAGRHVGVGRCTPVADVEGDGAQRQPAAGRHGVAGVDGEVDDHLLHLPGVDLHLAQLGVELGDELDVLSQQPLQHLLQPGDHRVEAHHPGLHRLPASEGEELLGEGRRALAGLLDPRQVAAEEGIVAVTLQQQVAVAEDGQQAVVEVVGDAVREAADGLHFLRVQELALQHLVLGLVVLALGDVANGHHRHLLALEEVALARDLDVHRAAVALKADALPRHPLQVHLARHQVGQRPADDLLRPVAEDGQQRLVDLQHDAVADDGDALVGGLEERAEALLAAPDLLLGGPALGDLLLRLLVEPDVLGHGRDLVGHRRQELHVAGREVVVRIAAAEQPDADGLGLDDQGDDQPHPGARRALSPRAQVAAAHRQQGAQLVRRRLRLAGGDRLLVEGLLALPLEEVEGRLADQQGGQDLVGDDARQHLAVEGGGDARRDDADHLLGRVPDAEDVAVHQALEAVAQQGRDGHEGQGDEEHHRQELVAAARPPAPAEDEEDRRVRSEQQHREGVGAEQAVGAELQRPQVVLVDGVDVAHRQDRHGERREPVDESVRPAQALPLPQDVVEQHRQHALEQHQRHQAEEDAVEHDAHRHPGGGAHRQDQAQQQQHHGQADARQRIPEIQIRNPFQEVESVRHRRRQRQGVEAGQPPAAPGGASQGAGKRQVQMEAQGRKEPDQRMKDEGGAGGALRDAAGDPQGRVVAEQHQHQPAPVPRAQEDGRHGAHQPEHQRRRHGEDELVQADPPRGERDVEGQRPALADQVDAGRAVRAEQLRHRQPAVVDELMVADPLDPQHLVARLQAGGLGRAGSGGDHRPVGGAEGEAPVGDGEGVGIVDAGHEDHDADEDQEEVRRLPRSGVPGVHGSYESHTEPGHRRPRHRPWRSEGLPESFYSRLCNSGPASGQGGGTGASQEHRAALATSPEDQTRKARPSGPGPPSGGQVAQFINDADKNFRSLIRLSRRNALNSTLLSSLETNRDWNS